MLEHLSDEAAAVVDIEAVRTTAERFVADPAEVTVILTGNYHATLRAHSAHYRSKDPEGDSWSSAGGVAIVDDAGVHTIVVRQQLWLLNEHEPLQSVAHEALHVANRQRGEDMNRLVAGLTYPDEATKFFTGYAGMVVEEYRVDRAVFGVPDRDASGLRHDFDDDLQAFAGRCKTACEAAHDAGQEGLDRFSSVVQDAFIKTIYTAAGVCAADLASQGRTAPKRSEPGWSRLVGPHYDRLRWQLSQIPDATVPTSGDVLQAAAVGMVPALLSWADHFGWTVMPGSPQGSLRTDWDV